MDYISRKDFPKVVEEVFTVLKPGGKIILLFDQAFDYKPLIEKYATADNFIFPFINGEDIGIKILPLKILKERACELDKSFDNFIGSLMQLPPLQRFEYFIKIFSTHNTLFKFLEDFCHTDLYEIIDHKESFTSDLNNAFAAHEGFNIIENSYHQKKLKQTGFILGSNGDFANYCAVDLRKAQSICYENLTELPINQMCLESNFYVFVAQKKLSINEVIANGMPPLESDLL
jgi:hypothetical protein